MYPSWLVDFFCQRNPFATVAQNFKNHINHRKRHAKYMYNVLIVVLMHVHVWRTFWFYHFLVILPPFELWMLTIVEYRTEQFLSTTYLEVQILRNIVYDMDTKCTCAYLQKTPIPLLWKNFASFELFRLSLNIVL